MPGSMSSTVGETRRVNRTAAAVLLIIVLGMGTRWTVWQSAQPAKNPQPSTPDRPPLLSWRRTDRGWEQPLEWPELRPAPDPIGRIHPLVVASGIALMSVTALLACERES
jgi:hypothetical protein